jgi:hypothetical protein
MGALGTNKQLEKYLEVCIYPLKLALCGNAMLPLSLLILTEECISCNTLIQHNFIVSTSMMWLAIHSPEPNAPTPTTRTAPAQGLTWSAPDPGTPRSATPTRLVISRASFSSF